MPLYFLHWAYFQCTWPLTIPQVWCATTSPDLASKFIWPLLLNKCVLLAAPGQMPSLSYALHRFPPAWVLKSEFKFQICPLILVWLYIFHLTFQWLNLFIWKTGPMIPKLKGNYQKQRQQCLWNKVPCTDIMPNLSLPCSFPSLFSLASWFCFCFGSYLIFFIIIHTPS